MNRRSDIDRVMEIWMADGPTAIPDRVVDVVAARIGVQRQRRAWPFPGRTSMTTSIKLVVALAAVLVVAVVGYNLLPREPGFGGPATPTPAPTPTAQPRPQPSATLETIQSLPEGSIKAGRYRFRPFGAGASLSIVADIPAGWSGSDGGWALLGPGESERADSIAIVVIEADGLYSDPCHWDVDGTGKEGQPGDVVVGPAAIDLVNALRASTAYTSTAPSPVSFGPFQGYELEIRLPSDIPFETCDREPGAGEGQYYVFSGKNASLYAQGNGNRWHLYIVDVGGTRVVVVRLDYEGTPAASREAADSIIASLEFTP